jgi:hypothetical protein
VATKWPVPDSDEDDEQQVAALKARGESAGFSAMKQQQQEIF